jgi:hypothetical protein
VPVGLTQSWSDHVQLWLIRVADRRAHLSARPGVGVREPMLTFVKVGEDEFGMVVSSTPCTVCTIETAQLDWN